MQLIDTHSHLNFKAFAGDYREVIKRARENDTRMIIAGSQRETSERAVEIAKQHESGVYAAVGLHPLHTFNTEVVEEGEKFATRGEDFDYEYYKKLASDLKVVAIGECGLDYYRMPDDKDAMKNIKVVLLHSLGGDSQETFFPWLKKEMESRGAEVAAFDLPDTENPSAEAWIDRAKKEIAKDNKKVILLGRSLGGTLVLHLLAQLPQDKVAKAILVAAPINNGLDWDNLRRFFTKEIEWEKIRVHGEKIKLYYADNDPYVPAAHGEEIQKRAGGELKIQKGVEHFCAEKYEFLLGEINACFDTKKMEEIKEKQREVFLQHVKLASEVGKPLIVHCREAHGDLLRTLNSELPFSPETPHPFYHQAMVSGSEGRTTKSYEIKNQKSKIKNFNLNGVMHCFSGDLNLAKQYIDLGFLISFTGLITFARDWDEVIKKVTLEKMMIETDCPYMTPVPHRGERNEPIYVKYVAEKIANLRGISVEDAALTIAKTTREFFRLP